MAHCPGCGNTVSTAGDVTFTDMDAEGFMSGDFLSGEFNAAYRYYVMSCAKCNRMLGGGVASTGGG